MTVEQLCRLISTPGRVAAAASLLTLALPAGGWARSTPLPVGAAAPAFELVDQNHHPHQLADFAGKTLILVFYPGDTGESRSGELRSIQWQTPMVRDWGAWIMGISVDSARSHWLTARRLGVTYPLLTDRDHAISRAYGVFSPGAGMDTRTIFVIGPDSRVRKVKRITNPSQAGRALLKLLLLHSSAARPAAGGSSVASTTTGAAFPGWSCPAPILSMPGGLRYQECRAGTGRKALAGDNVSVHYTGYLTNGTKFDSSVDRGTPFEFPLGGHRVIAGWDEGVAGMANGGRRKLIIPPDLGYGPNGQPPVIPPAATLIFDVEMISTTAQ